MTLTKTAKIRRQAMRRAGLRRGQPLVYAPEIIERLRRPRQFLPRRARVMQPQVKRGNARMNPSSQGLRSNYGRGELREDGTMIFTNKEIWGNVIQAATGDGVQTFVFSPGDSGLARLDQMSTLYECWRLISAHVYYQAGSGTSNDGIINLGIEWDPYDLPTTGDQVRTLQPNMNPQVFSMDDMPFDVRRANKANWMYTTAGGSSHPDLQKGFAVCTACNGAASAKTVGQLWLQYSIEFMGQVKPPVTFPTPISQYGSLEMTRAWMTFNGTSWVGKNQESGKLQNYHTDSDPVLEAEYNNYTSGSTSDLFINSSSETEMNLLHQIRGMQPNTRCRIHYSAFSDVNFPTIEITAGEVTEGTFVSYEEVQSTTDEEEYIVDVITGESGTCVIQKTITLPGSTPTNDNFIFTAHMQFFSGLNP